MRCIQLSALLDAPNKRSELLPRIPHLAT